MNGDPSDRLGLSVRAVHRRPSAAFDEDEWPATLPAVRQVLDDGLQLDRATILVGENGAGKSTLVEALAMAFGLAAEGGSTGARHGTHATESPLSDWLVLERGLGGRWGYFLRNETMHGLFTYLEDTRTEHTRDPDFHALSHGESFLAMLGSRRFTGGDGFFVFDEPEAGLSFGSQLTLLGTLHDLVQAAGQVLVATHSPLIAALPGATILEVGERGITPVAWDELDQVRHWRSFLDAPDRYFRHLLD